MQICRITPTNNLHNDPKPELVLSEQDELLKLAKSEELRCRSNISSINHEPKYQQSDVDSDSNANIPNISIFKQPYNHNHDKKRKHVTWAESVVDNENKTNKLYSPKRRKKSTKDTNHERTS